MEALNPFLVGGTRELAKWDVVKSYKELEIASLGPRVSECELS